MLNMHLTLNLRIISTFVMITISLKPKDSPSKGKQLDKH